MGKKSKYYLMNFFHEEFMKLIRLKKSFEYTRTAFTKKLRTQNATIIFNSDGVGDDLVLSLINRVRCDAKSYLAKNEHKILDDERIYFLDMFDIPHEEEIIVKVDLTSAYWRFALIEGIISEKTNIFFNETFDNRSGKEKKEIRLKGLGCLATRKEVETFENGKSISWDIDEQETKKLYMHICRQIDNVMRECKHECGGCIFYYWDCMFVRKQYEKQVVNFFTSKQFECKSQETRLTYDKIGTKGFFTSECDGKMYMVQQEDETLLEKINKK